VQEKDQENMSIKKGKDLDRAVANRAIAVGDDRS
jgi:hypothetical protein